MGSLIGLMLQQVFPESIELIVTQAVGLGILIIGLQMSLKVPESLLVIFIFSLMIGGIIGETIGVKAFLDSCAETMRLNFQIGQKRFSEAFIAGLILFAASPITIVGAIEEGFQKKRDLLYRMDCVRVPQWLQHFGESSFGRNLKVLRGKLTV